MLLTINRITGLAVTIGGSFKPWGKMFVAGYLLTGVSIINDIDNGTYLSAAGKAIKAFSGWYGIAWDAGVAVYESEKYIINHYYSALREYNYRKQHRTDVLGERNYQDSYRNFIEAEKRYKLLKKKY